MRKYKGFSIHKLEPNNSGLKYGAHIAQGLQRAQTLQGIKKLINNSL